jgi:hypothetical protein
MNTVIGHWISQNAGALLTGFTISFSNDSVAWRFQASSI